MNKTAIKNFAVWARNKLISDVSYKAGLLGITKDGIAEALPQSTSDVEFYDIGTLEPYVIRDEAISQRKSLVEVIRQKEKNSDYETALNSVVEEVAYTWFNRLIAVRFMEVNDYLPAHIRVLSSEGGKQEPDIVTTPFDADLFFAEGEDKKIVQMKNDNKLDEVFRILFIKQCRKLSTILPRLFEGTDDHTELLLNLSFVDQEGVVYHLVHDIPEDDFDFEKGGQVEIIGWLYQYYNAELKDETFSLLKNNVKISKERIPSVTQLFTPDWIVRYMVENSLGRLWIEGHPNNMLKSRWKYYIDETEQEESVKTKLEKIKSEFTWLKPEDIKVIDPCMGSGHILIYAFDVLIQIYENAGYTQRDAVRNILNYNLFGLDIDDRAAQLAYFAVMMKARQYNRRILDGQTDCNVYAIKESNSFDRNALVKLGDDFRLIAEKLLDTFIDAKEYGSIVAVDITIDELNDLEKKVEDIGRASDGGNLLDRAYARILCTELDAIIKQARVLASKYDAVVTNPPYMGANGFDKKLNDYTNKYYEYSKSDLFSVFAERCVTLTKDKGYTAMITPPSILFLGSFERIRRIVIEKMSIISVLHMGRGIFGIDFGSTAFVIRKNEVSSYIGSYYKLHQRTFQYIYAADIEAIFLSAKDNSDFRFDFLSYKADGYSEEDNYTEELADNGVQKIKFSFDQKDFAKIPGAPMAYWASREMVKSFEKDRPLSSFGESKVGLQTGDTNRFLRGWYEVAYTRIVFNQEEGKKWYPICKGGDYRRWYGNNIYVVNWEHDGYEIKNFKNEKGKLKSRPQNVEFYFKKGITWNLVSSYKFAVRAYPEGMIFDVSANSFFCDDSMYSFMLGILNSKIISALAQILNPTINYSAGVISNLPIRIDNIEKVSEIVDNTLDMEKKDWDSFEISWGFKKHPLV